MDQNTAGLISRLNRLFWALTLPPIVLLVLGYLLQRTGISVTLPAGVPRALGIVIFLVSVFLGIALPVLLRTLFNKRAVEAKRVEFGDFSVHQKRLVAVSVSAAYVAAIAYLLGVPNMYLYGSVLAGLYGIYSAIPSERKLKGELRFYGLGEK
jgi:hypothetical protein